MTQEINKLITDRKQMRSTIEEIETTARKFCRNYTEMADFYFCRTYDNYIKTENRYLTDCYSTFSKEKLSAYYRCLDILDELHGFDGRIVSHQRFTFSYGFRINRNNRTYFIYITKNNIFYKEI